MQCNIHGEGESVTPTHPLTTHTIMFKSNTSWPVWHANWLDRPYWPLTEDFLYWWPIVFCFISFGICVLPSVSMNYNQIQYVCKSNNHLIIILYYYWCNKVKPGTASIIAKMHGNKFYSSHVISRDSQSTLLSLKSLLLIIKFLNIRTPKKSGVIILKFEQCGSITEYCDQKM